MSIVVPTKTIFAVALVAAIRVTFSFPTVRPSSMPQQKWHQQRPSFLPTRLKSVRIQSSNLYGDATATNETSFSVKASKLDSVADLTTEEQTIINVFRNCGPSVAYVTSFASSSSPSTSTKDKNNLPRGGMSLGSGSAFVISNDGYLVTNYHVIERAYRLQSVAQSLNTTIDALVGNVTTSLFGESRGEEIINNDNFGSFVNATKSLIVANRRTNRVSATVYVRINSATKYTLCRIVDVRPELDMAVLKIEDGANEKEAKVTESYSPIKYGSSSNLLVGQRLIAIGNPFGLDQTVTSGVVSALDREVQGVAGNKIRGCIQTDAAINPGNSGGPLLDSKGQLVGVNTMIISTSGSNSGIGFAIPVDRVREEAEQIVDNDRVVRSRGKRKGRGWLGIELVNDVALENMLLKKISRNATENDTKKGTGVFVLNVKENSPAMEAGVVPLTFSSSSEGSVEIGDRIVAFGGNIVENVVDLENDLKSRLDGEQISMTVENRSGERRVLYVTLSHKR